MSSMTGSPGVITYLQGGTQRIYSFENASNGHLTVRYTDASQNWHWADQGLAPKGKSLVGSPGVVSYMQGGSPVIYAFDRGGDGHLYVNYWINGWNWADMGTPGVNLAGDPGVILYLTGGSVRIDAFARGTDGHLYRNYWDGSSWHWADQGTPLNTTLAGDPGVIFYPQGGTSHQIYAFARGADGHLYADWNVGGWHWVDHGTPAGTTVAGNPGVITYFEGTTQRIYAFENGKNGHLEVRYTDASQNWHWADQGAPKGKSLLGTPGVVSFMQGGSPKIYAFDRGGDGHLYVNWYSNGWHWADQGTPGTKVDGDPGVILYFDGGSLRIYAFHRGTDGHLYADYWDDQWHWADEGTPP
jgi:hypothetical protein